jgi:hypothetical protein
VIVNVVSQIPAAIWQRELPTDLEHDYVHTGEPVQADIHVVYGLRSRLEIPNRLSNAIFVASEPPEIREYNLKILRCYRRVLAPTFPYLSGLPNSVEVSAIAPWWVGTHAGGSEHYDERAVDISLTRDQLASPSNPARDVLSVIVSSKARTPLQQQRLRFVDYLEKKMTHIDVWGEGRRFAADKADVLGASRYHLAIENSQHPGYWTEKLSDPILMSNFVFYQGDPDVGATLDTAGIEQIDCWDMDGSYRHISDIMAADAWTSSFESRESNRRALLEHHSFHRVLDRLIGDDSFERVSPRRTVIPAQHPAPRWKKVIDPLYRIVRALRK